MEEIKPELKSLVKETFEAIKTFNEFIQKNTITDTITSATIKEDSISRASYKGPEGEFRVTLDHRIRRLLLLQNLVQINMRFLLISISLLLKE